MSELARALTAKLGPQRALTTPEALLAYECDGFTIHRRRPTAVALPETTEEVQWLVRLCNRLGVPFVARGAGTSAAGGGGSDHSATGGRLAAGMGSSRSTA